MVAAFELRPASAADHAFQLALYGSTRAEELDAWGWAPPQREAFIQLQYEARRRHYAIAHPSASTSIVMREGAAIGQVIVDRTARSIWLVDVAIMPSSRGAGFGTALIGMLREEAAPAGRPIHLCVVKDNLRAAALYRRLGFEPIADRGLHLEMRWSAPSQREERA